MGVTDIFNNFDFSFIIAINVLTYIIIKLIDYFNGDSKVPTFGKRLVLVGNIIALSIIYCLIGYDNKIILLNSAILAPVFWSWIASPVVKSAGFGYKDIDDTLK